LTRRLIETTSRFHPANAPVDEAARLDKVFYSSDGACAIEVALKLAFQYWRQCPQPQPQRNLFLAVGNAYHGDTLGGVSVGGVSRFHAMFDPLLFDVVRGPCPDTYRLPEGIASSQACEHYLAEYRDLFERYGHRLAALIVEPLVQGAAGMIMQPTGFLRGLRELCRQHDVLMIADEIAVGMGRTGTLWACEQEGVQPDFLCTGKGLTGGYLPMAATLTTQRVWDAFLGSYAESRSFFHGHTYGGNPLAAAAALATLDLFEQQQTLEHVNERAAELADLLRPLAELPHVGDVRQRGLIAAVELVRDKRSAEPFPWSERRGHRVCQAALEHGVWLRPLGNVIVIMPPLCITSSELAKLVSAVRFGLG
jgi:adenosylmethionine-8-amino-7-oxononanoate aminotransferase